MAEFTVFQIEVTRKDHDYINSTGWAGLKHDGMEHFRVKQDLSFDGSSAWHPDHFTHFSPALGVEADSLDEVFELTNLWNDESRVSRIRERAHSTSVGDIICNIETGEYFMVNNFGFEKIEVNDEEYA